MGAGGSCSRRPRGRAPWRSSQGRCVIDDSPAPGSPPPPPEGVSFTGVSAVARDFHEICEGFSPDGVPVPCRSKILNPYPPGGGKKPPICILTSLLLPPAFCCSHPVHRSSPCGKGFRVRVGATPWKGCSLRNELAVACGRYTECLGCVSTGGRAAGADARAVQSLPEEGAMRPLVQHALDAATHPGAPLTSSQAPEEPNNGTVAMHFGHWSLTRCTVQYLDDSPTFGTAAVLAGKDFERQESVL